MRVRTVLGVATLALAVCVAAPVTSYAALTTLGPATLSTSGLTNDGSGGGTYIPYSGAAPGVPAPEFVSPIEGTIVTWRIASGSAGGQVRLRVLRPAGGGKFTGAGASAIQMTNAGLAAFATSLPIKAGDVIGIDNSSSALIFKDKVLGEYPALFAPALVNGGPAATPAPLGADEGFQLQINADIQPTPSGGSSGGGTGSGGTTGGGTGGGGGAGSVQQVSATLATLKVLPSAFKAAGSGGSIARRKPKSGATVSYTDTQAATTTFTVFQSQPGRKNNLGICVKPRRKPQGKRCARLVTIGRFIRADMTGANSFHFTGRVKGRSLNPGAYQLQAVARNSAGLASTPVGTSFRIKK